MNKIKLFVFIVVFINFITIKADNDSFECLWHEMQRNCIEVQNKTFDYKAKQYVSSYYNDFLSNKLNSIIFGEPKHDFLTNSFITPIMVRGYVEKVALYEECFLRDCISNKTKKMIARFSESNKGLLDVNCKEFNCSSSTLGHLFYIAKVLESCCDEEYPNLILEIGGGFGNLAKLFKQILPESTIVIIDLPQMNMIQKMFLNYTSPEFKVVRYEGNNILEKGAINLVSVCFLEDLSIKPDLLISTFALSESSEQMQKIVINNNFFDAKKIYITGQLDGWRKLGFDWIVDHNYIINAIRERYIYSRCVPFHFFDKKFLSYELFAQ